VCKEGGGYACSELKLEPDPGVLIERKQCPEIPPNVLDADFNFIHGHTNPEYIKEDDISNQLEVFFSKFKRIHILEPPNSGTKIKFQTHLILLQRNNIPFWP